MPRVPKPAPVQLTRMPARSVLVLLVPAVGERPGLTEVTTNYLCEDGGSWTRSPAPRRMTGPKLRADAELSLGSGWRRCGDWAEVETIPPCRGWIAQIEPIPEES